MARQLTEKQKRFATNKYVIGMSSRDAAKTAGYSIKSIDQIGYENSRLPSLREYALSKIRDNRLSDKVIETYRDILNDKPSKPATRQDQIAVGREIAQIEGHYAPKRHEKITLTGTFDAMDMAQKLQKLEELKQRLILENDIEGLKSVDI